MAELETPKRRERERGWGGEREQCTHLLLLLRFPHKLPHQSHSRSRAQIPKLDPHHLCSQ